MTLVKKRLLSLTALCLVAGAVGVGLWWQERQGSTEDAARESAQHLFEGTLEQVATAELKTPQGEFKMSHLGTGEAAWALTEPLNTLAEASTVESLLRAALELKRTARVGGQGPKDDPRQGVAPVQDLAIFGLEPPRYTLTLITRDGLRQSLRVGKKNGFSGALYVKREGSPDVALVDGNFEYQVDKDLFKLREKRACSSTASRWRRSASPRARGRPIASSAAAMASR